MPEYITKEAVKQAMRSQPRGVLFTEWELDQVPTVDAEVVVRGHWIDSYAVDGNGKKVYDSIDCSVCEEVYKIESHDREYWKSRFKRCFCCGARMVGV